MLPAMSRGACLSMVLVALVAGCDAQPQAVPAAKAEVAAKAEPAAQDPAAKADATAEAAVAKGSDTPDDEAKAAPDTTVAAASPVIDHEVLDIEGKPVKLSDYRGKAVMIVNTASQCGFTPQYAKLQGLYGRYKDRGLVVLGFPSNDYGNQEPGTNDDISKFVEDKFAVDFPMMDKIHTRGDDKAPLYKTLTEETPEGIRGEVKWNFTKFLVDPEGKVVARFETPVDPLSEDVVAAVEQALPKGEG